MPSPLFHETIKTLLNNACPSIRFRIHTEILGQSPSDERLTNLQTQIQKDGLVREVFSSQKPDGWLGADFHGFDSIETGIRILVEKGLKKDHPVLTKALNALQIGDDRLHLGIGKVGKLMDDLGLGGSQRIKATIFAHANVEKKPSIQQEITKALDCFRAVRMVRTITEIAERFKGRLVFKPGVIWPDVYALRLLAFTKGWRTQENLDIIRDAIHSLVSLSPIPKIHVRYKSRWLAPGSFAMHDFNPDIKTLDDSGWMLWFHRMEMMSRLDLMRSNPDLSKQVKSLLTFLDEGYGMFISPLNHYFFKKWGPYSGLILEKDWRSPKRRAYDLTFRSLLILHYSGITDFNETTSSI